MDKHLLVVTYRLVAFSGVLATTVVEESRADRLADLRVVLQLERAARHHWQAEPVHDLDELLAHILRTLHRACLDEVLVAPLVLEAVHLPSLVHGEHRQVVAVLVVELGALLVRELLLLPRTVEDILDREH